MVEQPSMAEHLVGMMAYDSFISYAMYVGIPLAFIIYRLRRKGISAKLGFNIWTIVILGLILRLPLLDQPFWYDEAFTSAMVQVPIEDFIPSVQGDVHPPFYYALVRGFTEIFGHNDIAMRLPALLSSLGLIVTMYHIGKAYGGIRIGKWSALLTAILPALMYYAAEARYPAFLALGLSVAYIGIQQRNLWLFSIPLGIVAFTHVNGWIYIVVMSAVWILSYRTIRALIIPFSSMGIWFPVALNQSADVADGFWLPAWSPWMHVPEMTIGLRFDTPDAALMPVAITTAIILVSVWLWRKQVDLSWMAVVIAVPFAQWIVGVIWHPIYLPRTLIFSALLLIIPVAFWLENYAHRYAAAVGLIAILVAYIAMNFTDKNLEADEAVFMCNDYSTIYATNMHSGILARHFSDARVIVYEDGNSTAQQLPVQAQNALFDDVDNIFNLPDQDICVFTQVSVFNTPHEVEHIEQIIEAFDPGIHIIGEVEKLGYYMVLHIQSKDTI